MSTQKYASLSPAAMKDSSGLFDNVDGVITRAQFSAVVPDGYSTENGSPLFASISIELKGDGPAEERTVTQGYSLGASSGAAFTVSADGYGLIPSSDDSTLRKGSKWGTFIGALVTEGFPVNLLEQGDLSVLVGLSAHFKRIADKETSFRSAKAGERQAKFPPATLVVTKIHALPNTKTSKVTAATASSVTPTSGSSVNASSDFDLDTATGEYLLQVVAAKGGKVQRSQLTLLMSQAAMKSEHRTEIAKRATNEEFLNSLTELGVIAYNPASKPQIITAAV